MIIVLPFSTAYSLIIQPNISYAATEPADYPAGPVLPFSPDFLMLDADFANFKPLDFIAFTGTLIFKNALQSIFISPAGTFLSVK